MTQFYDFIGAIDQARRELLEEGKLVDSGRWQGVPTGGKPDLQTIEVLNWQCSVPINSGYLPDPGYNIELLKDQIQPNLPWADDHFAERVSRVPSNPGEAYRTWPWWRGQFDVTAAWPTGGLPHGEAPEDHQFTHTYQERFWPKGANEAYHSGDSMWGIRYRYGDLDDLIVLLLREPYTRQAYLPIFFPEDTGAVHGGRIPCTLGYHFMLRDGKLHMWYAIRSCDFVRHFRDDLYLACRLLLWVIDQLQSMGKTGTLCPGNLYFTAYSLHYHRGDEHHITNH